MLEAYGFEKLKLILLIGENSKVKVCDDSEKRNTHFYVFLEFNRMLKNEDSKPLQFRAFLILPKN